MSDVFVRVVTTVSWLLSTTIIAVMMRLPGTRRRMATSRGETPGNILARFVRKLSCCAALKSNIELKPVMVKSAVTTVL